MKFVMSALLAAALAAGSIPDAPAQAAQAAQPERLDKKNARAKALMEGLDHERLWGDEAYAKKQLARIEAALTEPVEHRFAVPLTHARTVALMALRRDEEALEASRALVGHAPEAPFIYGVPLIILAQTGREIESVGFLEAAARHVTGADLPEFRRRLFGDLISRLFNGLPPMAESDARGRFAEALLTLQWPDPARTSKLDIMRLVAARARLARGDAQGARALAAALVEPHSAILLVASSDTDALLDPSADRVKRVEEAIRAHDEETQAWLKRNPDSRAAILDRARFLRSVGREEDALALLLPHATDTEALEGDEDARWIANEAAYALLALDRADEAVAVMERLARLDPDKHPGLVAQLINYGDMLILAGRHAAAAEHLAKLDAQYSRLASDIGRMWLWSKAACAHWLRGDAAGTASWLAKVEAKSSTNRPAHSEALVCLDRADDAEKVMMERLRSEEGDFIIVGFQNYTLGPAGTEVDRLLRARRKALIARPAVAAEIARKGRSLSLPLSKAYWGGY
jgi:tetratricopeptide (TPR) repeat protein